MSYVGVGATYTNKASTTSFTISSGAVPAGGLVVLRVSARYAATGGTMTVSDTTGATWTVFGPSIGQVTAAAFMAVAVFPSAATSTITVTFVSQTPSAVAAYTDRFVGYQAVTEGPAVTGSGTTTAIATTSFGALANNTDLIIGATAFANTALTFTPTNATFTAFSTTYTVGGSATTNNGITGAYDDADPSGSGTTLDYKGALSSAASHSDIAIALKPNPPSTTPFTLTNLEQNPSSEVNAWVMSPGSGTGTTVARSSVWANTGTYSSLLTKGSTGYSYMKPSVIPGITPSGVSRQFGCWVMSPTAGNVHMGRRGASYVDKVFTLVANVPKWIQATWVGDGTTNTYFDVGFETADGTTGRLLYLDSFIVIDQPGILKSTDYFDGDTVDTATDVYSWTGTAHASTSTRVYTPASGGASTGHIKIWNGSAWVAKPVKIYNGTAWVTKPLKRYNGTAWVPTSY